MLPSYLRNEIARRLVTSQDVTPELARSVGIDPDAQPGEPDCPLHLPRCDYPPVNESRVIRGSLPFEITTSCMGRSATTECRVRFVLTLDDIPQVRGRPGRSISRIMFSYDVMEWQDFTEFSPATGELRRMPHPQWVPIRLDFLFHPQLLRELQDRVEAHALEIEH